MDLLKVVGLTDPVKLHKVPKDPHHSFHLTIMGDGAMALENLIRLLKHVLINRRGAFINYVRQSGSGSALGIHNGTDVR